VSERPGSTIARRTLDNGMTVLTERRGLGPVVFSGVVYRVGSRAERPGITGISHLLEHMMFKGTEKYGKGEVAALVERNGGELNAFTSEDATMYYEVFAKDRWQLALEIESERMTGLKIDSAELDSERRVVLEERVMYRDIPAMELSEELMAATFRESPYRWPIIGWEADIEAISRDDVMAHYQRYYSPGNAVLVVVGDVGPDEVFAAAQERFGSIPPAPSFERRIPVEPPWQAATRIDLSKPASLPQLQLMFRAPAIATPESEALYLLATVLTGTKTSRLDLALLETRRAGDVHVYYHAKTDPSGFVIEVEGVPGVPLDEVEDIVWRELDRLKSEEIEAEELDRSLNQVEAHRLYANQSPSNRGFLLGWHEALGDAAYADQIVEKLRSRTPAELREAAQSHFVRGCCGTARLNPVEDGAGRGRPASLAAPGSGLGLTGVSSPRRRFRSGLASVPTSRRITLDNGMNVTLQPDHTDHIVAVALLFHGGAFLDPPGRSGLSSLTASTLERGTRSLDFVEFSRRFERIGSDFSLDSGTELVHGNAMFLARHLTTGLSLVADLLEDPGYRADDLEVTRALALNDLEAREDDLDEVAEDAFFRGVAQSHPYANLPHGTREGLSAIETDDLRAFHREAFRADGAHMTIVGDFDEAEVERLLAERFGRLTAGGSVREPVATLPPTAELSLVSTRPDKSQAKICLGGAGLGASDPDRFAGLAMNHVLGASSIRSRLGDEIRDNRGLAYSVSSRIYERSVGGFFLVHMGTRPENVRPSVDAIRGELTKIANGVTETELEDAQEYLTGSFPLRFTTYGRLARFWARASFYGWPGDYLATYVDRIRALTVGDLTRVAGRLVPNARVLSVAGPIDAELAPVRDSDG
jgi:zinc protease